MFPSAARATIYGYVLRNMLWVLYWVSVSFRGKEAVQSEMRYPISEADSLLNKEIAPAYTTKQWVAG